MKPMKFFAVVAALSLMSAVAQAVPPKIGPTPPLDFKPPKPERLILSNGVIVYLLEDHELPVFDLSLQFKTSPADEPKDQPESVDAFGVLWRGGGTKSRTNEKLNEELEQMAASVETGASHEVASISVSCLSKDVPAALEIFTDVLMNPIFDEKQLTLYKAGQIESLRRKNETPDKIGRRAFRDVLYGRTHVYARDASVQTVNKLNRSVLSAIHKKIIVPDAAIIAVAGDFKKDDLIASLENHFKNWKKTGRVVPPYDYAVQSPPHGSVFLVQKEFSQSRVSMGSVGVARHHPDHFSLELADYILGGGGASRLFGEIRSRLGLAYVVASFFTEFGGPGMVGVVCQTKGPSTVQAVHAMRKQLDLFAKGPIRSEEISLGKESIVNSFVFRFNSSYKMVYERAILELLGFEPDYLENYLKRVEAVTPEEIQAAARKYFNKDNMKTVIVGDRAKFGEALDSLGPVVEIPLKDVD